MRRGRLRPLFWGSTTLAGLLLACDALLGVSPGRERPLDPGPDGSAEAGNEDPDASSACGEGLLFCGTTCVDPQTSGEHCGRCDHDCRGAACSGGACLPFVLVRGLRDLTALAIHEDTASVAFLGHDDGGLLVGHVTRNDGPCALEPGCARSASAFTERGAEPEEAGAARLIATRGVEVAVATSRRLIIGAGIFNVVDRQFTFEGPIAAITASRDRVVAANDSVLPVYRVGNFGGFEVVIGGLTIAPVRVRALLAKGFGASRILLASFASTPSQTGVVRTPETGMCDVGSCEYLYRERAAEALAASERSVYLMVPDGDPDGGPARIVVTPIDSSCAPGAICGSTVAVVNHPPGHGWYVAAAPHAVYWEEPAGTVRRLDPEVPCTAAPCGAAILEGYRRVEGLSVAGGALYVGVQKGSADGGDTEGQVLRLVP